MTDVFPIIQPGKRATIAGRTGTGKTSLAKWLVYRSPGKWVILNPKHTAGYNDLPGAVIVRGFDLPAIEKAFKKPDVRFIDLRPEPGQAKPEYLDAFIDWLHNSYENVGLLVDELYSVHIGGRPGPGLTGWLTRGRELRQSYIGLTQRPKWVSRFVFSEADYIGAMDLALADDRKTMVENTGKGDYINRLERYKWLWYNVADDQLTKFGPVPI